MENGSFYGCFSGIWNYFKNGTFQTRDHFGSGTFRNLEMTQIPVFIGFPDYPKYVITSNPVSSKKLDKTYQKMTSPKKILPLSQYMFVINLNLTPPLGNRDLCGLWVAPPPTLPLVLLRRPVCRAKKTFHHPFEPTTYLPGNLKKTDN